MLDIPLPTFRAGMTAKEMEVEVRKAFFALSEISPVSNQMTLYGNSETVINANGIAEKTTTGKWTPILANTAATYYDIKIDTDLIKDKLPRIIVRSKIDGTAFPVEIARSPVGRCLNTDNSGNYTIRGFSISKINSGQIRVSMGFESCTDTVGTGYSWASLIGAVDGYDAWALVVS